MPYTLRPFRHVTRTDRVYVSDGVSDKLMFDRTSLFGATNWLISNGFIPANSLHPDYVVIPKGSVVGVADDGTVGLPGLTQTPSDTLVDSTYTLETGQTPLGVAMYDFLRYAEDLTNTYVTAYTRGGDTEGDKALIETGEIELPMYVAQAPDYPMNVKWGAVYTTDADLVFPGVYLGVNGYGQFTPQATGYHDKGDAFAIVVAVGAQGRPFTGALGSLARRDNYVIGTDGLPPIETGQSRTDSSPFIIPNSVFDANQTQVTMVRLRLMFG